MSDKPTVSIIIPVYNTEKYLVECLNSVINQTYESLEIILINDGSTDNSKSVCEKYKERDRRIKFISRENRGLSSTRQEGIDLASGEYFCTLDSDDAYSLSFIDKMVNSIISNNADICVCGRTDFSENEEEKKLVLLSETLQIKNIKLDKQIVAQNIAELHSCYWLPDAWNKLYRTDFVRSTGVKYCLDNKYNGTDLLFNQLLVLYLPKFCIVNEPLLLHRYVEGSRVHRKDKPLQEGFEIITDAIFSEAKKLNYPENFYSNYSKIFQTFLLMSFKPILRESCTFIQFVKRIKKYYRKKNAFLESHPQIELVSNIKNVSTLEQCYIRNNYLLATVFFFKGKLRRS